MRYARVTRQVFKVTLLGCCLFVAKVNTFFSPIVSSSTPFTIVALVQSVFTMIKRGDYSASILFRMSCMSEEDDSATLPSIMYALPLPRMLRIYQFFGSIGYLEVTAVECMLEFKDRVLAANTTGLLRERILSQSVR